MLTDRKPYGELGGTNFTQRDPERSTRPAITQLGYRVTLDSLDTAA
ncbi:hypothetical protein [Streptomyces sp. NPDC051909]